jgi:hypothetical protein
MSAPNLHLKARLAALLLTAIVGGCASAPKVHTASEGEAPAQGSKLSLVQTERKRTDAENAIGQQLTSTLRQAGLIFGDQAPYLLDYSYAVRSSAIGISNLEKGSDWLSAPGGKRGLFACQRQVYRLTLVVVEQQSGKIAYRGASEQSACAKSASDEPKVLLNALIADLMAKRSGSTTGAAPR